MRAGDTRRSCAAARTDNPAVRSKSRPVNRCGGRPIRRPCALGSREASPDALLDPAPLKLGDGAENVHLEFSGRRRGVDALGQAHEVDAESLQLVQQRNQVLQVPPEPIKAPDENDVEAAALRVADHVVQRRPAFTCAADTVVAILASDGPAAGRRVPAQLRGLVLRVLVRRRHAGVDGNTHVCDADMALPAAVADGLAIVLRRRLSKVCGIGAAGRPAGRLETASSSGSG
jgi:hypothetical protein